MRSLVSLHFSSILFEQSIEILEMDAAFISFFLKKCERVTNGLGKYEILAIEILDLTPPQGHTL